MRSPRASLEYWTMRTHVRTQAGRKSALAARVQRSARAVHQRFAGAAGDVEHAPDLRVRAVLELVHDQRAALAGRQILEIRDEARDGLAAGEDRHRAAAGVGHAEVLVRQ